MPANPPRLLKFVTMPGPFVSEWPELPKEVFRSWHEAHDAAIAFIKRFDMGEYKAPEDCYWAREMLPGGFRFTQFVIADTRAASWLAPVVN